MSTERNREVVLEFLDTMADHGGLNENLITKDFRWWGAGSPEIDAKTFKGLHAGIVPQALTEPMPLGKSQPILVIYAGSALLSDVEEIPYLSPFFRKQS
jgi:hypothetical protein